MVGITVPSPKTLSATLANPPNSFQVWLEPFAFENLHKSAAEADDNKPEELFKLQIIVKNEAKSDKNKINVIEQILEIIDDNKEKIHNMTYINIMEFLQKEYISNKIC